jgi:hypothetical protein
MEAKPKQLEECSVDCCYRFDSAQHQIRILNKPAPRFVRKSHWVRDLDRD